MSAMFTTEPAAPAGPPRLLRITGPGFTAGLLLCPTRGVVRCAPILRRYVYGLRERALRRVLAREDWSATQVARGDRIAS